MRTSLRSWAPLVSIPVHVLLAATPFPSELVGVANGTVYGLWLGTLYAWIGWWCGAVLEYAIVRLGARQTEFVNDRLHVPVWMRRFPAEWHMPGSLRRRCEPSLRLHHGGGRCRVGRGLVVTKGARLQKQSSSV